MHQDMKQCITEWFQFPNLVSFNFFPLYRFIHCHPNRPWSRMIIQMAKNTHSWNNVYSTVLQSIVSNHKFLIKFITSLHRQTGNLLLPFHNLKVYLFHVQNKYILLFSFFIYIQNFTENNLRGKSIIQK